MNNKTSISTKKSIISFVLVLSIVFSLCIAALPEPAFAASSDTYNMHNGISDASISDVFGSGVWDKTNKILTLSGIDYSHSEAFDSLYNIGMRLPSGSTIVLEGTNNISLENTSAGALYAFYCAGNLRITGNGTLNIFVSGSGVTVGLNLTSSGKLTVDSEVSITVSGGVNAYAGKSSGITLADGLTSSGGIFDSGNVQCGNGPFSIFRPAAEPEPSVYYAPEFYIFTPKAAGGKIDPVNRFREWGDIERFSVEPDPGYVLTSISAVTERGKNVELMNDSALEGRFVMPASDVYIRATFAAVEDIYSSFTDLEDDAWYKDAVCICLEKGWFHGCGGGIFRPLDIITNSEIAIVQKNMGSKYDLKSIVKNAQSTEISRIELCTLITFIQK